MGVVRVWATVLGALAVLAVAAGPAGAYVVTAKVYGHAIPARGMNLSVASSATFHTPRRCQDGKTCYQLNSLKVEGNYVGSVSRVSGRRVVSRVRFSVTAARLVWDPVTRRRSFVESGTVIQSGDPGCRATSRIVWQAALPENVMSVSCAAPGKRAVVIKGWRFSLRLDGSALSSQWTLKGKWPLATKDGVVATRAGDLHLGDISWALTQQGTKLTGTGTLAPGHDANLSDRIGLSDGSVVGSRLSVQLTFYWASGGVASVERWIGNIFKGAKPGNAAIAGTAYYSLTNDGFFWGGRGSGSCFGPCMSPNTG